MEVIRVRPEGVSDFLKVTPSLTPYLLVQSSYAKSLAQPLEYSAQQTRSLSSLAYGLGTQLK